MEEQRSSAPGDEFPLPKVMAVVKRIVGSIIAFSIVAIQVMDRRGRWSRVPRQETFQSPISEEFGKFTGEKVR